MIERIAAAWSLLVMRGYVPLNDAVYVPVRWVAGHRVAWFVADVVVDSCRWLLLEPVAFWIGEDVIRARWALEDSARPSP